MDILDALAELGTVIAEPLPEGAAGARGVTGIPELHRPVRRDFQLLRTLPNVLLHVFESQTSVLPRSTETKRIVVQRFRLHLKKTSNESYRLPSGRIQKHAEGHARCQESIFAIIEVTYTFGLPAELQLRR